MQIGGNFQSGTKTLIAETNAIIADENSTITETQTSTSPELLQLISQLTAYPHIIDHIKSLQDAIIKKEPSKIKALLTVIHAIAPAAMKLISTFFASPLAGLGIIIDQIIGEKPTNG